MEMKDLSPHDLLFLEEVAELTRARLSCVRFWVRTGKLPSLRPGRRVMVRRTVLEKFLADSERQAKAVLAVPTTREQVSGAHAAFENFENTTAILGVLCGWLGMNDDDGAADIVSQAMIRMAAHEAES